MRHPFDPPDTQPIERGVQVVLRMLAVALVAFWCVVTVALLVWREL